MCEIDILQSELSSRIWVDIMSCHRLVLDTAALQYNMPLSHLELALPRLPSYVLVRSRQIRRVR